LGLFLGPALEEELQRQSVHWGDPILFQKCYESVSSVPVKETTLYYIQVRQSRLITQENHRITKSQNG